MKVGFIGLGRMGQAMSRRVLDAGHDLIVFNRTREKTAGLAAAGAAVAASIAEVAAGRDVVITMVTNDAALEAVVHGDDGLLAALPPGAVHVAMGTHGVALMQDLRAAHRQADQILVAAPVLGRPDRAAEGQLGVVAAGPAQALELCRPLFEVIGRRTFEAGTEPEAAAVLKITNNFVLACAIEVMGEGFALTRKYGIAPTVFYDMLTDGLFSAPAYKVYGKIIAEESYHQVGVTATIGLKDINLALAAGQAVGVPLPSAAVVRDRFLGAIAHGDGELDWSVVADDQARASGLK